MDQVSLVLEALAAWSARGMTKPASAAVEAAHDELVHLLAGGLAENAGAESILAEYEVDPLTWKASLAEVLLVTGICANAEVMAAARQLIVRLGVNEGPAGGRDAYFAKAQGVQVGDGNQQVNIYNIATDWSRPQRVPVGELIQTLDDPWALEVHRAIEPNAPRHPTRELPELPVYVQRLHDERLAQAAVRVMAGESAIVTLVGGSSTGKTRACWEVIQRLPAGWRLWHPIFPDRAEAFLAELDRAEPRTVVWMNEAQHYLLTREPAVGERVAAGLRQLLRDRRCSPVLVLCTVWPRYWEELTEPPLERESDLHPQARALLTGTGVEVPDRFSGNALAELKAASIEDPRLAEAAQRAENGQITQYLAGVPVLMERYRTAPPVAKAVINVAIDAFRMSYREPLSFEFLNASVPGYLTDVEWSQAGERWLERAIAYATAPCNGINGPLAEVRTSSSEQGFAGVRQGGERLYRLADYISQVGSQERMREIPPAGFWDAAATSAGPQMMDILSARAMNYMLYRAAAQIYKNASIYQDGAVLLLSVLSKVDDPGIRAATDWVAAHAHLGTAREAVYLLKQMQRSRATPAAIAVLVERAASGAPVDDGEGPVLFWELVAMGNRGAARKFGMRLALGAHIIHPSGLRKFLRELQELPEVELLHAIALRAAASVPADSIFVVGSFLAIFREMGLRDAECELLDRNPASAAPINDAEKLRAFFARERETDSVAAVVNTGAFLLGERIVSMTDARQASWFMAALDKVHQADKTRSSLNEVTEETTGRAAFGPPSFLRDLKKFGHAQAFSVFADYLARSADLGDLSMVASLIGDLRELGARAAIDVLIERIEQVRTLKGVGGVPELINELRVLAAFKAVSVLGEAMQGLDFSALEQPGSLGGRWPDVSYHHRVLRQLDGAGARDAASALALRLARAFPLDNLWATSDLVAALRDAKAEAAVQALHDRIACMTSVTNPWGIDRLIAQMREAGGQTALQALFRLAEAIPLTTPDSMTQVLHSLRLAGGIESARILAGRVAEIFQLDTKYNMENLVDELRAIDATDAVAAVQRFSEEQRQTWETRERAPRNREFHPADLLYVSIDRSELPGARYGYEPNGTPSLAWGWHSLA